MLEQQRASFSRCRNKTTLATRGPWNAMIFQKPKLWRLMQLGMATVCVVYTYDIHVHMCVCIHMYINIYTYTHTYQCMMYIIDIYIYIYISGVYNVHYR